MASGKDGIIRMVSYLDTVEWTKHLEFARNFQPHFKNQPQVQRKSDEWLADWEISVEDYTSLACIP